MHIYIYIYETVHIIYTYTYIYTPIYREFGGDGKCTHIPYTDKISPSTTTKSYHIHEYYGMIMVWHVNEPNNNNTSTTSTNNAPSENTTCAVAKTDKESKSKSTTTNPTNPKSTTTNTNPTNPTNPKSATEPHYFPPLLAHLGDMGEMVFRGTRSMSVNMNIREFCENSTDFAVSGSVKCDYGSVKCVKYIYIFEVYIYLKCVYINL